MTEALAASDADVRQLFEVPPARFVAARAELVKTIKANGERDRAAAVAGVRKPSATAWALDRVVADGPEALEELLAANDALRAAMADAGSHAGTRFRDAAGARQRAVAALADRAGGVLRDAGVPATRANLDRITATLMATAEDPDGADLLRRGILDHDLSAGGGFEVAFGVAGPAPKDEAPVERRAGDYRAAAKDHAEAARRRERAERDAERAAAAAADAARAADASERRAVEAERNAEAAAKVAATKRREADKARREADRAAERARSAAQRLTDPDGPTRR